MKLQVTYDLTQLKRVAASAHAAVVARMDEASIYIRSYLLNKRFTGGTSATALGVRSGHLRSQTHLIPTKAAGGKIAGGVDITTFYASVHIGPKGQTTVIRPKNGKFLTIPTEHAKTAAGAARQSSARNVPGLFFLPSRKGGGVLVKRVGRGKLVPYFILKKSVTVRARIAPADVQRDTLPGVTSIFEQAIKERAK